tara:strand:+ start:216 stop:473 length:258 start_codon:yes stop_codon:yes gene_type:complete
MKFKLASVTRFRHTRDSKGKQTMKMKEVKNGSLYYNEESNRVERVVGSISDHRVVTYYHKKDFNYPQARVLRIASKEEYEAYLNN